MANGIPDGFEEVSDLPDGFEEVKDEPGYLSQFLKNTGGVATAVGDMASGFATGIPLWLKAQADVAMGGDAGKERQEMHEGMARFSPSATFPGAKDTLGYQYAMKPFELLSEGLDKGVEALGGGERAKLAAEGLAMVAPIPGLKGAGKLAGKVIEKVDPGIRNAGTRAPEAVVRPDRARPVEIPAGFEEVLAASDKANAPASPFDPNAVNRGVAPEQTADPRLARRQMELQLDNPTLFVDEGGVARQGLGEVPEAAVKHAEELRAQEQLKQFTEQAQQGDLFDPYTNMAREYDQFSNDPLPRALSKEEFAATTENLAKTDGTVYEKPADIDAAYQQYLSTMDGKQPGFFDRPSQQEAFKDVAKAEADSRIAATVEQTIQDHPLVRGAKTHLANMEAKLAEMEARGASPGEIQAQQRKVAASEKRLETTAANLRAKPMRARGKQQGMVDPKVFGEALSKGLDKLGALGKPVLGAMAQGHAAREKTITHIPGLSDYKPINTPEVALRETLATPDIKPLKAQSASSGPRNLAIRSGHPLVKFFNTMVSDFIDGPAKTLIDEHLNSKQGVASLKNKLKPNEFEGAMTALMEGDQLGKTFSREELFRKGLDAKQVDFIESVYRNNEAIWQAGGKGPKLEGYFPHNFSGDYLAMVYDKETGNPVYVLNAKNAAEFKQAKAWADKTFDQSTHNISEPIRRSMESRPMWDKGVLSIEDIRGVLGDGMLTRAKLENLVNGADLANTRNIYNFGVHDKARAREQVGGFDGNKPWKDGKENLHEAYESYVRFSEQAYYHHTMEKPLNDVKQLLNDPNVKQAAPNAVDAVENYMSNITGQPLAFTGKALDGLVDGMAGVLGQGRSAPRKMVQELKGFTQMFQLGFDIVNFAVQSLQPIVNGIPQARVAQKLSGMSPMDTQRAAMKTWIDSMHYMVSKDKPDGFIKDTMDFADKQGLLSFSETEAALDSTKGKGRRVLETVGNAMPRIAERGTRAPFFVTMSGILREAWKQDPSLFKDKQELFQTAKNMTQSAMVDYSEFQRPYAYRKYAGTVGGSMLGQFKTYMHGQLGFLRQVYGKDKAAFGAAVAMMIYFSGLEGLPGFEDVDNLVKYATNKFGDSGPQEIRDIALKNAPEWAKTGGLSSMTGLNLQSRFAFAPLINEQMFSNPAKLTPATSTIGDMIGAAAGLATNRDELSAKNLAYQMTPRQYRGLVEEQWFNKGGDFMNPKTGMKETKRTEDDWAARRMGVTSLREAREREDTFHATEVQKAMDDKKKGVIEKGVRIASTNDGRIPAADLKEMAKEYVAAGGDPEQFVNSLMSSYMAAAQTRKQRAQGNPSTLQGVQRYQRFNEER